MTFYEAMAFVKAAGRVRRAGWLDLDHLVHRDRVAERRRTSSEIYLVEVIQTTDVPGSGIVGVMPYESSDTDRLAADWIAFELPDEWDLDEDIDYP